MIFKIKKELYKEAEDYAVRGVLGDLVCKIAKLKQGYYIYNKSGEQISQLTFSGNAAFLSVVSTHPTYPGATKLSILAKDSFRFSDNVLEKGDEAYLKNVTGKQKHEFSVWGKPSEYGFDIYDGSLAVANVIPCPADETLYQVRVNENTNLLFVLMICLAVEKLSYDPQSKL